jgi:hypothetical protein
MAAETANGASVEAPPPARHTGLPSVQRHCRATDRGAGTSRCPHNRAHLLRHASRGWSRVGTWLPCPDVTVRELFLRRIGGVGNPFTVMNS